ncbi:hypothetical protein yc1106_04901 [Curvularia clavata]|uniref:Uncharacterized protein n=1 Tax=Curvularia clavata TaxID=95742 RepID=A0A9Q8Z8P4_CURCL|nr:hypothetical protein yc1106_04901 [Curvularia clavata]
MTYTHAATQTVWAGITKMDLRPDILFTAPNTTTPPAELASEKHKDMDGIAATAQLGSLDPYSQSFGGLLQKRPKRPSLPTRISLPNSELDDEVLPSPPPTHAILSPLPEANKLHAGHTPLIPRALSPVHDEEPAVPQTPPAIDSEKERHIPLEDQPLIGPLMLPTNPDEGASDHIALDVLDDVLEKVAKDQDRFSKLKDAPEPSAPSEPAPPPEPTPPPVENTDVGLPLSRNSSGDSRKSAHTEVVDGVKLKTPPLNFGVPIGQV